jgi:hypothetical protein
VGSAARNEVRDLAGHPLNIWRLLTIWTSHPMSGITVTDFEHNDMHVLSGIIGLQTVRSRE